MLKPFKEKELDIFDVCYLYEGMILKFIILGKAK